MRHLWSLIAGLAAAPLMWVLLALGQQGSATGANGWEADDFFRTSELIAPAGYLLAAAALFAALTLTRFSPVAPAAAGLPLPAVYALLFVNPFRVHDAVPDGWSTPGDPVALMV